MIRYQDHRCITIAYVRDSGAVLLLDEAGQAYDAGECETGCCELAGWDAELQIFQRLGRRGGKLDRLSLLERQTLREAIQAEIWRQHPDRHGRLPKPQKLLLPCPFCGSPAKVEEGHGWPGEKITVCSNEEHCRAQMSCIWTVASETELWNRRIEHPMQYLHAADEPYCECRFPGIWNGFPFECRHCMRRLKPETSHRLETDKEAP